MSGSMASVVFFAAGGAAIALADPTPGAFLAITAASAAIAVAGLLGVRRATARAGSQPERQRIRRASVDMATASG
jgi:hypothetical protein